MPHSPRIESIYPLSPLQQGMLSHSLQAPKQGMYEVQSCLFLRGALDADRLRQAWQDVMDCHAILRTVFRWERLAKPLQVVQPRVLPWQQYDWRLDQALQWDIWLASLRKVGLDLSSKPWRLHLIHLGTEHWCLVWHFHHILLDGWSMARLWQEVAERYNSRSQSDFPVVRPFSDYIAWLHQLDQSQAEMAWRKILGTSVTPLRLPQIRADQHTAKASFGQYIEDFSGAFSKRLRQCARHHSLSLNTLFLGAWSVLLSRYSGQQTVIFGTTLADRPPELPGADRMIGLLLQTIPVRICLPNENNLVWVWLQQLQLEQIAIREYAQASLTEIQRWSGLAGDQALFDSLLVFENYPFDISLLECPFGLELEQARYVEQAHYGLVITIIPGTSIRVRFGFRTADFDEQAMVRLAGHLRTLLEAMITNTDQPVADLPMLTSAEKQQLWEWNTTAMAYPSHRSIVDLFEQQVTARPKALALFFGDHHWSYQTLDQQANQIAHHLLGYGLQRGDRVGLYGSEGFGFVSGLLGILKATGVYLPLDPTFPIARLYFMLVDSGARMVLSQEALPASFTLDLCLWINRQAEAQNIAAQPIVAPPRTWTLEVPAYLIYTSGSTGGPKGVLGSHRGVVNRCIWMEQHYPFGAQEVACQKTSSSFIDSISELFSPLLAGCPLLLVPTQTRLDTAALVSLLASHQVSRVLLVPAQLRALLAEDNLAARLPTVTLWLCSGDTLAPTLVQTFFSSLQIGAWCISMAAPRSLPMLQRAKYDLVRPFILVHQWLTRESMYWIHSIDWFPLESPES